MTSVPRYHIQIVTLATGSVVQITLLMSVVQEGEDSGREQRTKEWMKEGRMVGMPD